MTKRSKLWPLFLVSVAVVAIIFLSAGLSEFELRPGQPFPIGALQASRANDGLSEALSNLLTPSISFCGMLFVFAILVILTLWLIVFIMRPKARKRLLRRMISYLLLLLLVYGLINALQRQIELAGGMETPPSSTSALLEPVVPAEELPSPPTFIIDPPHWFTTAVTLTLITLLVAVAWFIWRHRPRSRAGPAELLVQEAKQAIEALRAGSDLKDTVMRCYLEMSRVLSEQRGVQRQKAMTPREFENHLLEIGLHNEHIQRLTRLFESVRYGANSPGKREEREAVACLTAIVETYGRSL